jgi:hypothetical protein
LQVSMYEYVCNEKIKMKMKNFLFSMF